MRKNIVAALILLLTCCMPAWAVYGVRLSDLMKKPTPPNPVKVWGKVTSQSPLKISDGRTEVEVTGLTAVEGDLLVVTGNWNGTKLALTGSATAIVGPARIEMIWIPAGSFLMGNTGREPFSVSDEFPQHSVDLPGYWIGKYEITRGQYRQFIDSGGYSNISCWFSEGWAWRVYNNVTEPVCWAPTQDWAPKSLLSPQPFTQTERHPVVGTCYYEAEAFCNWAGGRLPGEAEWEKAARGTGAQSRWYPWGNSLNAEMCNNMKDTNPAGGGIDRYQTSPVGSYPAGASPYGCQDMAGNVWEWCEDWYKSYPGSTSPFDESGDGRCIRGGAWSGEFSIRLYRCADRGSMIPMDRCNMYGIRMAR